MVLGTASSFHGTQLRAAPAALRRSVPVRRTLRPKAIFDEMEAFTNLVGRQSWQLGLGVMRPGGGVKLKEFQDATTTSFP